MHLTTLKNVIALILKIVKTLSMRRGIIYKLQKLSASYEN